jgi:hypothetical protein
MNKQELIDIYIPSIDATVYIDKDFDECFNSDSKVRIYDSRLRFLDYFETDTIANLAEAAGITPNEEIKFIAGVIRNAKSIEDLLDNVLCINSYIVCGFNDISPILENYQVDGLLPYEVEYGDIEKQREFLLNDDYVNVVGKYLILQCDY